MEIGVARELIPPDGLADDEVRKILSLRRVAVVGMSRDPSKPAHYVPRYLLEHGYEVIPVNPFAGEILGLRVYKTLGEVPGPVDIVDVFRPSVEVMGVAEEALRIMPRVFWMQEGIYNESAARLLSSKGVRVVWNRCMMKEHKRLIG